MIVTVPFSRSYSAIVSGMRSPSASARRMMNWPGFAFFAMSGASISIRVTVGFSASFFRIVYITLKTFLSVLLFYPCGAFSNAESCKKRRNAYSITEKNANYNAELSKSRVRLNCQKVACGLLFQQIPAAAARQEEKLAGRQGFTSDYRVFRNRLRCRSSST